MVQDTYMYSVRIVFLDQKVSFSILAYVHYNASIYLSQCGAIRMSLNTTRGSSESCVYVIDTYELMVYTYTRPLLYVFFSTTQVNIPLNNPLDNSVILSCECSNTKHFIIPALTDSKVINSQCIYKYFYIRSINMCILYKHALVICVKNWQNFVFE